jgi:dextranase
MYTQEAPGYFGEPGVLYLDAVIFASGGDHVELGDGLEMLNGPYFPNHNLVMSTNLKAKLLSYYNFLVAYENLLRGNLTHVDMQVSVFGVPTSSDGSPNTVWAFGQSNVRYDVVQLVNFDNQPLGFWQDPNGTDPPPRTLKNIVVGCDVGRARVTGVFMASPDLPMIAPERVAFRIRHGARGNTVVFRLPSLRYWDMVYMTKT